jgi:hypothetical protein
MQSAWFLRDSEFGSEVFKFAQLNQLPISCIMWRRYLRLLIQDEKFDQIVEQLPSIQELAAQGEISESDIRTVMIAARWAVRSFVFSIASSSDDSLASAVKIRLSGADFLHYEIDVPKIVVVFIFGDGGSLRPPRPH